jgi:hypothetical protein
VDFRPHSSVVEHFLGKEEVTGSNPVVGSKVRRIDFYSTHINIFVTTAIRAVARPTGDRQFVFVRDHE